MTEPLSEPPAEEGDDQAVAEGAEAPVVEEDELEDASDDDDNPDAPDNPEESDE